MIARTRTAMKFFTYGLLIGLLFAPRSGKETRSRILTWASESVKTLLGG
jgi:gas vesicle protein